jgi:hypothetical protein
MRRQSRPGNNLYLSCDNITARKQLIMAEELGVDRNPFQVVDSGGYWESMKKVIEEMRVL